jgi:hypothetical protein
MPRRVCRHEIKRWLRGCDRTLTCIPSLSELAMLQDTLRGHWREPSRPQVINISKRAVCKFFPDKRRSLYHGNIVAYTLLKTAMQNISTSINFPSMSRTESGKQNKGDSYSAIAPNDIPSMSFRPGKRSLSFCRIFSSLKCDVPQSGTYRLELQ